MASIKHIHMFVFLILALIITKIQFSEGRQIKAMMTTTSVVADHREGENSIGGSKHEKDGFQPTTPGNSPGVGHSFEGQKRNNGQQIKEQADLNFNSPAGKADAFQPTTPGHSPGVGHSFGTLKQGPNV
ncbi:hypothetical protein ABFS82_08G048200 [Erythranthe guttata]